MDFRLKERTRQRQWIIATLAVCCSGAWAPAKSSGEEVSRQPPPIYREKLAAFLTPLGEVLRPAGTTKGIEDDGIVLLDEEFNYIDDKGRRYWVDHHVYKAVTDSGVKDIAEEVHTYRKANQRIYLALAQTILPDGKRMPIRPGAAILQSPQRQADYSLYDDQGELRLIFPNVKPGAITESIVVVEESRFRIPGEFTAAYSLAYGWPIGTIRRSVEMPSALGERLRVSATGRFVPEPEKQQITKNRTRFTWKRSNVEALPSEPNRPPTHQTGPALWLTTLPDWDTLVKWYAPLVNERSRLKPSLEKQIDEWTKAAHTPQEILEILMAKVATDIRYTGLEFGAADLQPHDCSAVWENQYGDCKDKANLLRAMLQRKGITAYLVLLNTEHAGRIERRSPDYRQFNHAIVAVEREPGQYLFCDPTITYAKPGMLSPSDTDREVLLVKSNAAEWARTPPQDAGSLHYDLDLKLARDGELSGWLTQETSGYYGVADADYYRALDKDRLHAKARDVVQGFFKGAEIVDVTRTPIENWDGVYRMKAYFVVPATNREGQGRASIPFPHSNALFVNPGARKERETPYYTWRDTVKVSARIRLPDGYVPAVLPHPFQIASTALDGAAQWSFEGNECRATLEVAIKQDLIPPDQFGIFQHSLLSLRSWLDNPLLLLATTGGKAPEQAARSVTLENFPMMPNGDGQLSLVDQRFPSGGDPVLRREALQKVMQYFPADKSTMFNAGVRLAVMDWAEGKAQEAADQIQNLLHSYRDSVNVEDAAWGDYMLALALKDAHQPDEALKLLERIGGNNTVSQRRRAWGAYQRARILETKSATSAIKALREGLAFETDVQPTAFTFLAKLLIIDGRIGDLKKEIKQLIEKKPPQYAAILTRLAESAGNLLPAEKAAQRLELMQILEDAEKGADLGAGFGEALQAAREGVRAAGAADRIRESLKKYLVKTPLPELDPAAAQFKVRADFARAITAAEKDQKPEQCIRYGIELLTRFEPDEDFPAHLWKATSHADWKERFRGEPEPLLPVLLDLCEQLPPDYDTHIDGKLLRAKVFVRNGDIESAQKIHEELLKNPKLSPGFKVVTHARLAENLEMRRDYAGALEIYRAMEAEIEFPRAREASLRATFLNLELGNRDEAVRVLGILASRGMDAYKQLSTGAQIIELGALVKDRQNAEAYWDASAKWWSAWLALEQKLGMKPQGTAQVVPAIADLTALGTSAGNALRAKDRDAFFGMLRTLAHAARWQPSMTVEFLSLLTYTPGIAPESADELRKFAVTVSDLFVTEDLDLIRKNQMYGVMNCIDTSQNARAIEIIHAFNEKPGSDDAIAHAMARLWAVAAQRENRDIAPAVAALEKALTSATLLDRGTTVTLLANLYRKANRTDDEEKLLKGEIEHPQIKSVPADLQALTARYREMTGAGEESRQFSTAAGHWLKNRKPDWFDFAEPKTLEDPRVSNLDEILKEPEHLFIDPEVIKLQLLVATSPTQPYERTQHAFLGALNRLSDLALTVDEARSLFDPVIDDPEFPESFRVEALWHALFNARLENRTSDFEKLRARPLVAKMNDDTKGAIEIYHDALAVDTSSPDGLSVFCDRLMQKDITSATLGELRRFFARLLVLGEVESAEKIYRRLADVPIGADVRGTRASLQMEFLKVLNRAKKWAPAGVAMRGIVLTQFPADAIRKPEIYGTLHGLRYLDWLDEDAVREVRLYQIKTREFEPGDFYFWKSFVRTLPPGDANRKLVLDLIAVALQNAPGDMERASAVVFGSSTIDTDDAVTRSGFGALLRPYRKAEEFPATYGEIRAYELFLALRSGEPIDLEADFGSLHQPGAAASAHYAKLRHYIQTRDLASLRKTLESIGPDELLSDRLLGLSLRAFEMAGMNDELELARDAAKKAIYRGVLQSWTRLDPFDLNNVYEFAGALHDSSSLPENWVTATTSRLLNRRVRLSIAAEDADLRKDWPRLLQVADEAIKAYPTYYHFQWYKGAALYHLGRKPETIEPLHIYVRYARDEFEYPKAMEWLNELEPGAVPQTKPGVP